MIWFVVNEMIGIQDASELGIEDVSVQLFARGGVVANSAALASTTTDANGRFSFTSERDGVVGATDYELLVLLRDVRNVQYTVAPQSQGSDPTVDSDAMPITLPNGNAAALV